MCYENFGHVQPLADTLQRNPVTSSQVRITVINGFPEHTPDQTHILSYHTKPTPDFSNIALQYDHFVG